MNIMENIIYYGVMIMSNSKPRWINEIPGVKNNGKKRKLTKKEKKEAKEFRDAIIIKLMNGLIKISLKIWINDIVICLLLYRTLEII